MAVADATQGIHNGVAHWTGRKKVKLAGTDRDDRGSVDSDAASRPDRAPGTEHGLNEVAGHASAWLLRTN